ncbi:MAG: ParB N-terminal domain-containing protein [Alistipes sp.]|nr:ParB N-terminal domain-containing protein [Alistipes sp.]
MTKKKEKQPKYKQSETIVIRRSQINFAPYNPRKEDPEVVKKLKKNFKSVGFLGGIVWNTNSSYLVSGHKRVQTLDIMNDYDGTESTDYDIKVEAVELDDKTEREQNIFMNSPSAMGEFDMEKMKILVPEIDYHNAGLSEADMNIYGIAIAEETISVGVASIVDDFEAVEKPYEERKAAVKEMKNQIKKQAEAKVDDIESFVMINFKSYKTKSSFMLRFGFPPDGQYIDGETFADMIERVE